MMISRRNFAMITAIMLVILFMFQSTGIAKKHLNDAHTNEYALENQTAMRSQDAYSPDVKRMRILNGESGAPGAGKGETEGEETTSNKRLVLFLGDGSSKVYHTVRQWCTYSKRALLSVRHASECEAYLDQAEIILVDGQRMDLANDIEPLREYVDGGCHLIFCNLPDAHMLGAYVELEELLGITAIYDYDVELTGVHLFEGLLIGGERIYRSENEEEEERFQDMELTVPWYLTLGGNKSYMVGLLDDLKSQKGDMPNEYAPNLIWRTSKSGKGQVFAVNGTFLEDTLGIGILEGMLSDLHGYEIYPVVNAQNFSVINYPSFANENSGEMQKRYSRELPALYRDIIWQSISTVTERGRYKTTALLAPQYNYGDDNEPSAEAFTYYARLFRENRMEIGISLEQVSRVPLDEKLENDLSFLNEHLVGYVYRSAFAPEPNGETVGLLKKTEGLQTISTLVTDYDSTRDLLYYVNDCCVQQGTNDAFSHTYMENLRMHALESALGYTSVVLNMNRVAYPETEEDNWERLYEAFSSNLLTYWKVYSDFEKTTLSESDVRIRRFLNLDFTEERTGELLRVSVGNFETEAYFILRTHGERIARLEGAGAIELEDDAYLIRAESETFEISLENDSTPHYY